MANPLQGEYAFSAGDANYTLRFTTNAICTLEKELQSGLNKIIMNMDHLTTVRAVLWAGIIDHHKSLKTPEEVGPIIDKIGMAKAVVHIGEALKVAFPQSSADPNE